MKHFIDFGIYGLGAGGAYALTGIGVVVIHRGSGILNFAQGAIAMFSALTFYWLVTAHGLATWVAALVVVALAAVLAPLLFLGLIRPIRKAPVLAKVVLTIGLLGVLEGAADKVFNTSIQPLALPSLLPSHKTNILGAAVQTDRMWLLLLSILVAVVLWGVFRFTRFGLATRAVSENELGAGFLGYSSIRIGAANWSLGCALAALAGILLLPIVGLDVLSLSLVVLPALAAALVGRFASFGLTLAGGLFIGVAQSLATSYSSQPGISDLVPLAVVILVMLIAGQGVPPRSGVPTSRAALSPPGRIRIFWLLALPAAGLAVLALAGSAYKAAVTTSMITALPALSLVIVTGYLGQISLAQMTFAGIGGFAASKFAMNAGVPFPWPLLMAVGVTIPGGLLLGLPALRIRGLNLAVVTLGAAIAVSSFVFQNLNWTGGTTGSLFPSPQIAGLSLDPFTHGVRFGIFVMIVVASVVIAVANLRGSATGRRLLAIRTNERAAAAVGVNVARTKLLAFALSAGIAGLGGALLGYQIGSATYQEYTALQSIQLLAVAYIGGIASVAGGLFAGLVATGGLAYVAFHNLIPGIDQWWLVISSVALVLTVLGQPDGVITWYYEKFHVTLRRRNDGRAVRPDSDGDDVERVRDGLELSREKHLVHEHDRHGRIETAAGPTTREE